MSLELPRADKPEDVGLSSERLQRLTDTLKSDIDKGIVPGAVALIARRGEIAYEIALGYRDREAGTAMEVDTIFRIASMTKPFTSLAAMMLAEEGKLLIADPVARFIPEFAELKVATNSDNASAKTLVTEPCRRQMTVQDLLRHTSGFTYAHLTGPLLKQAYEAANVGDEKQTNAEMAAKLATVPLAYQPGSTWQYGMSTDVLGRVVESASGIDLDRFIIERICKPLGLKDTSFGPIAYARAAQPQVDAASGKRPPMRDPTIRSNWISGGSALLSTARDYVRFCQMLLNGGELGGTRTRFAHDHHANDIRSSEAGDPSQPVDSGSLRRSGAITRVRAWFRARVRGENVCRAQSVAGIGRRLFVERRDGNVLLDRSEAGAHCHSADAGAGTTDALSLLDADDGLSGDHAMNEVHIYTARFCPYCASAKSLLKRKGIVTQSKRTSPTKRRQLLWSQSRPANQLVQPPAIRPIPSLCSVMVSITDTKCSARARRAIGGKSRKMVGATGIEPVTPTMSR